jgi:hypothetical protein
MLGDPERRFDALQRFLVAAVLAALTLVGSAIALGARQPHCGPNLACIVRVAHRSCERHHDRHHCLIWRRHRPQAHVAHVLVDTACGSVACDQAYLVQLVGAGEAACAESVIAVEDPSYNPLQSNTGGSGAYGIPQAMGGMASAGPDWQTDPQTQLRWLISYSDARYGDLCGALAHERSVGWY